MVREYIYLNGEPLAQVNAGSPETVTYLHTDHLGTPKYGTNAAGAQVWAWAPDAFGNGAPTGSATVNLRMPGQYFDAESGMFYNWNRYYSPEIGRYISSDPIGLAGGINTFLYAGANPVMMIDPEGQQTTTPIPGAPGLPIILPPIAIPGTPENEQWVQAAEEGLQKMADGAKSAIEWCVNQMARSDQGSCSCQHRDVHTSSGQSCQALRELGICGGPYKGTGSNSATCQAAARESAPASCRGCLGHCNFTPAK